MLDAATQDAAPLFSEVHQDTSLMTLLNVYCPGMDLRSQTIKLQHNVGGGGCFPLHFDTDAAVDSRKVTAIFYLNPEWREGDGGELVLYPFPKERVAVQPLSGRMALFSSPNMLHRVLPSRAARVCFTLWLTARPPLGLPGAGRPPRRPLGPQLEEVAAGGDPWGVLGDHSYRKHLSKLFYAEEWAQSIKESHAESDARQAALDVLDKERGVILAAFDHPEALSRLQQAMDAARRGEGPCPINWMG